MKTSEGHYLLEADRIQCIEKNWMQVLLEWLQMMHI